jgi:glycosyltransferase involved in cell wall biosynthesis
VFYARPSTPRRASEFGFLVLQELAERRPDIIINIVGADVTRLGLKFPFVNHGSMQVADLPNLYNRCAVGLMFSMTSSSLLPLEVMACGAVPITNDGGYTRIALRDNPNVEFLPTSPSVMADHIIAAVDRPDQVEHSRRIAQATGGTSWDASGQHVVSIFDRLVGMRRSS